MIWVWGALLTLKTRSSPKVGKGSHVIINGHVVRGLGVEAAALRGILGSLVGLLGPQTLNPKPQEGPQAL